MSRYDQNRPVRPLAVVLFGIAAGLLIAWFSTRILLLAFVAVLLAVLFDAVGRPLRHGLGLARGLANGIAGFVVTLALVLGTTFVLPVFVDQAIALATRLPDTVRAFDEWLTGTPVVAEYWRRSRETLGRQGVGLAVAQVQILLSWVTDALGNLLLVLFTAFFLALEPVTYRDGVVRLVPPGYRAATAGLFDEMGRTLRAWLGGQLVVMVLVGTATGLGLWALGLPFPLALGVLAGVLNIVPYIGPLIAALPAILLASGEGIGVVLWTLALFVVVQQIEGNLLLPLVQRTAVVLPPALLLVALFGMAEAFGLLGAIVAAPLLAVAIVFVRRVYVEGVLERGP